MSRTHLRSLVQLYLALAHRPDGRIDEGEADAIVALLSVWLPPSAHEWIGPELKAAHALEKRGGALSVEGLVLSLKPWFDAEKRAHVLQDLERIALADGRRSEEEAALLARVHHAWTL